MDETEHSRLADSGAHEAESTSRSTPFMLETREQLRAILQGVTDGVVVQDSDGHIRYVNEAAAQLFSTSDPGGLLGRTVSDAFAQFDILDGSGLPITINDLPAREVFGGAPTARRSIVRRDRLTGEERWWIITASPVSSDTDTVPYVVCIIRDATDRVRAIRANARLATIVESSADAIVGKTLDAIVTSWNPAAERLYGYTAREMVGRSVALLIPPDRPDELAGIMARVRAGEQLEPHETIRVRKDGRRVDVALSISPIRDQDGRITGASTIARDITGLRRSQELMQLLAEAGDVLGTSLDYRATLDRLATLLVPRLADSCSINMVDASGIPTRLAHAHADPAKIEVLRQLEDLVPPEPAEAEALMQAVSNGEPLVFRELADDFLLANARSSEHLELLRQLRYRSVIVVPMMARGSVVGTISLVYAESDRRYQDDEIELAREIARRAALAVDNAILYADAQQAARAREDFLLTASHELRTPLTSVKASAQLIARYLDQPQPDHGRIETMVARLQTEIGRLEALSVDLLDAARIQRGRFEMHLEPVDLVTIADEVLASLERSSFRRSSHRLVLDASEPVSGIWDAQRLQHVVTNLVSNALKYSPDGGEVCVRIRQDG
ncbi:MAG TPA: PAS domain S-box protein, partial [Thermomicrobiales bacterium]|nr:PAS domain S-box protein [Thermomicrobiales bacterium]